LAIYAVQRFIPLIVQGEKNWPDRHRPAKKKMASCPPAFSEREVNLLIAVSDMVANAIQACQPP